MLTALAHKPSSGTEATDITAFHPDQRDWQERDDGCPEILRYFEKPLDFVKPKYELGFIYFDGFLVLDYKGHPLKPFRNIPLTLSSKLEGWRAEAIRRSDPRIGNKDLVVRMPVKVKQEANGETTRDLSLKDNAIAARQSRYREEAGAITWVRKPPSNVYDFLWSLLPQHCKDNNLALPRDLTSQEQGKLKTLNLGKRPDNARNKKGGRDLTSQEQGQPKVLNLGKRPDKARNKREEWEKRTTHDQYIASVLEKASGRGGKARRQHKKAVRNARRESTADSQDESPPGTPTSLQGKSGPPLDLGMQPNFPEDFLKVEPLPGISAASEEMDLDLDLGMLPDFPGDVPNVDPQLELPATFEELMQSIDSGTLPDLPKDVPKVESVPAFPPNFEEMLQGIDFKTLPDFPKDDLNVEFPSVTAAALEGMDLDLDLGQPSDFSVPMVVSKVEPGTPQKKMKKAPMYSPLSEPSEDASELLQRPPPPFGLVFSHPRRRPMGSAEYAAQVSKLFRPRLPPRNLPPFP